MKGEVGHEWYKIVNESSSITGSKNIASKIHSSIKAIKKLTKIVRINFFRTLKINQRLRAPQGVFMQ